MALIRGVGSLFPCPRCLIPEAEQGNPLARAPLRTADDTRATIQEARGKRLAGEKEEILKAAGLRDVDVRLYYWFVLPLINDVHNRTCSGRSTTQTRMPRYLLIVSTLSPAVCFDITSGNASRRSSRHWVGMHARKLTMCMHFLFYVLLWCIAYD